VVSLATRFAGLKPLILQPQGRQCRAKYLAINLTLMAVLVCLGSGSGQPAQRSNIPRKAGDFGSLHILMTASYFFPASPLDVVMWCKKLHCGVQGGVTVVT
jgi:hypothetical protein